MTQTFGGGWSLEMWESFSPMLFGKGTACVTVSDGAVCVEVDEDLRTIFIPTEAIEALIAEQYAYELRKAECEV